MRDYTKTLYRRSDNKGLYNATWLIRAPWAHPIWSDYALLVLSLKDHPNWPPAKKLWPDATHELMLYALDPSKPLNFDRDVNGNCPLYQLSPPNLGYQFKADSDDAADARVAKLVKQIEAKTLSPDTDFRWMWDAHFADGRTCLVLPATDSVH